MQEHDDVDTLARLVIETLDTMRAKRDTYILAVIHPTLQVTQAVGPYATYNQALKDFPKRITAYDRHSHAYAICMKDPSVIDLDQLS